MSAPEAMWAVVRVSMSYDKRAAILARKIFHSFLKYLAHNFILRQSLEVDYCALLNRLTIICCPTGEEEGQRRGRRGIRCDRTAARIGLRNHGAILRDLTRRIEECRI